MISIQQPNFGFVPWFDQLGRGFYLNTLRSDGLTQITLRLHLFDFISSTLSSNHCGISFACRFFEGNNGVGN